MVKVRCIEVIDKLKSGFLWLTTISDQSGKHIDNEIIPTDPVKVDWQFCQRVSLLKAKHSQKLLDEYIKRIFWN